MYKAIFLEGHISFTITPDGPILIKASDTGSADPTHPNMEFVRTKARGGGLVYIPGASLKGVIRAHCERICRSLDSEADQTRRQQQRIAQFGTSEPRIPLADNPLANNQRAGDASADNRSAPLTDDELRQLIANTNYNSGRAIEAMDLKDNNERTMKIYRYSSLTSQMFGHTSLAGRIAFADAYPQGNVLLEERNGVAIDRIYGSVAVGPFNYETVVGGTFATNIAFKNITLAQLGLLGLALRDLNEGRIAIGFGKSRGLGRVKLAYTTLDLSYPTSEITDGKLHLLGQPTRTYGDATDLLGIGAFCAASPDYKNYAFPNAADDRAPLPNDLRYHADELLGTRLTTHNHDHILAIWRACMPAWKRAISL